jgi:hypothetical protein
MGIGLKKVRRKIKLKKCCQNCNWYFADLSVGYYSCECDDEKATDEEIDKNWDDDGINCIYYEENKKLEELAKLDEYYLKQMEDERRESNGSCF